MYFILVSTESFFINPLRNLQSFNSLILGNVPLFQTETILTAPEIILHPNANEIDKMCVQCVRNCVEITKVRAGMLAVFRRWLLVPDGSDCQLLTASSRGDCDHRFHSVLCQTVLVSSWLVLCRSLNFGVSYGLTLVPLSSLFSLHSHDQSNGFNSTFGDDVPFPPPAQTSLLTYHTPLVSCLFDVCPWTLDMACPRSCPGFPFFRKWHQLNPTA